MRRRENDASIKLALQIAAPDCIKRKRNLNDVSARNLISG